MISRTVSVVFSLIACLGYAHAQQGECLKVDDCKCVYEDGLIVDLHPLARTDGQPAWGNSSAPDQKLYSWNPCMPFTYLGNNSECISVAVCMINPATMPQELMYDLGRQESAQFVGGNDSLTLEYMADMDTYKRHVKILLECKEDAHFAYFIAQGETGEINDTIYYEMVLASKHACAHPPHITPAKNVSSSLSGGTIFLIVCLSLIAAYIIFGVAYQSLVKNETGYKRIPNHAFWISIPTLVKSGCKCVTGQNRQEKAAKYDSI